MKAMFSRKVVRFLIAGASAAFVEYVLYVFLYQVLGQSHLITAQSISFLCGLLVSFLLNRAWVFSSSGKPHHEFVRYLILAAINLVCSNILIYVLTYFVGLHGLVAKIIVMGCVASWNYTLFSKLIFRTKATNVR